MKVIIVHQHFRTPGQGGAIRSWYLAKALVDDGVRPVIITAHNEPRYRVVYLDGFEVHYLPVPYDNRFGFYRRLLSFWRFAGKAAQVAALHRDADLCYAISTPLTTGIAAGRIRRRYGIPYIFEVGDLWPEAPVQMGFIRNGLLKSLLYRMEKKIYQRADAVVALSPPISAAIATKVPGKKVFTLPNMSDTAFYRPQVRTAALEERFGVAGKFVVTYAGAIGMANGLHLLLDCADIVRQQGLDVHFFVCGEGAMTDELKATAFRRSLTNVTFAGFMNRDGIAQIMSVSDAAFICYQRVPVLETGSPNKYFDGLAAGKLILVNFGGWIREEIEREGCGVYVDPANPGDFVKKIKPFLSNELMLRQYQSRARSLAEREYSRTRLGDEFVRMIRGTVSSGSAAVYRDSKEGNQ